MTTTLTVLVTRNASGRIRGFLASCMCEVAPGVYTAPRMTTAVRDRVWKVLEEWTIPGADMAMVMVWPDARYNGGQAIRTLGTPQTTVYEHGGVFLTRRAWSPSSPEAPPTPDAKV